MLLSVPRIFCHPYSSSELLTPSSLLKSSDAPMGWMLLFRPPTALCAACCHGLATLHQSCLFVAVFVYCELQESRPMPRVPVCSHMTPGPLQSFAGWSTSAPQTSPRRCPLVTNAPIHTNFLFSILLSVLTIYLKRHILSFSQTSLSKFWSSSSYAGPGLFCISWFLEPNVPRLHSQVPSRVPAWLGK